jgi:hypothetical protein
MTGQNDRLAMLARLAALLSDRALGPVAEAKARVAAAQVRADAMAQARSRICVDAGDPVQAALMGRQVDGLRHRHIAAMSELAGLQAQLDHATASARPAFGRKIALDRMYSNLRRRP